MFPCVRYIAVVWRNANKACQIMRMSCDTFCPCKAAVEDGGVKALTERNRHKPNLANRVDMTTEQPGSNPRSTSLFTVKLSAIKSRSAKSSMTASTRSKPIWTHGCVTTIARACIGQNLMRKNALRDYSRRQRNLEGKLRELNVIQQMPPKNGQLSDHI